MSSFFLDPALVPYAPLTFFVPQIYPDGYEMPDFVPAVPGDSPFDRYLATLPKYPEPMGLVVELKPLNVFQRLICKKASKIPHISKSSIQLLYVDEENRLRADRA